jgi:formylglycine-generating enzyme required for sulfatase activity
MNANLAVFGCYLDGLGTCSGVTSIAPVGSIPLGNGLFGQADLAGNVAEWTVDGMATYGPSCDNCAYWDDPYATFRARRGGSFEESISNQASSSRINYPADWNLVENGVRCARIP